MELIDWASVQDKINQGKPGIYIEDSLKSMNSIEDLAQNVVNILSENLGSNVCVSLESKENGRIEVGSFWSEERTSVTSFMNESSLRNEENQRYACLSICRVHEARHRKESTNAIP